MKDSVRHEKMTMPPSTLLNPVPVVMVSCAGLHQERMEDRPNIVTIAWAGTICSEPPMVSISVRKSRHSHRLIEETGEFVVNLVGINLLRACDLCGVRSGASEDKFAAAKLTAVPAQGLTYASAILEAPVSLSCKVVSVMELGSHDLFVAKIVAVTADKYLLDKEGKLCLEKADLVCYSHGDYYTLGRILGFYGYSVASPEIYKRRMAEKGILKSKNRAAKTNIKVPAKANAKVPAKEIVKVPANEKTVSVPANTNAKSNSKSNAQTNAKSNSKSNAKSNTKSNAKKKPVKSKSSQTSANPMIHKKKNEKT